MGTQMSEEIRDIELQRPEDRQRPRMREKGADREVARDLERDSDPEIGQVGAETDREKQIQGGVTDRDLEREIRKD